MNLMEPQNEGLVQMIFVFKMFLASCILLCAHVPKTRGNIRTWKNMEKRGGDPQDDTFLSFLVRSWICDRKLLNSHGWELVGFPDFVDKKLPNMFVKLDALQKTNQCPPNKGRPFQKERTVFQPLSFREHLSFRGSNPSKKSEDFLKKQLLKAPPRY